METFQRQVRWLVPAFLLLTVLDRTISLPAIWTIIVIILFIIGLLAFFRIELPLLRLHTFQLSAGMMFSGAIIGGILTSGTGAFFDWIYIIFSVCWIYILSKETKKLSGEESA